MKIYTQLTREQRYQIKVLLKTEHNQTEISKAIGVDKSTISRELGGNRGQRGYLPNQADEMASARRKQRVKRRISDQTWLLVEEKLRLDWSPEQISRWLAKNGNSTVSHEHIYQHVYVEKSAVVIYTNTCAVKRSGANDMANTIAGAKSLLARALMTGQPSLSNEIALVTRHWI